MDQIYRRSVDEHSDNWSLSSHQDNSDLWSEGEATASGWAAMETKKANSMVYQAKMHALWIIPAPTACWKGAEAAARRAAA
jgi:hypothetical protein